MKLVMHSQISTSAKLKFGMDKQFHPTFYNGSKYLSILGLKLIRVTNRSRSLLQEICVRFERLCVLFCSGCEKKLLISLRKTSLAFDSPDAVK